LGKGSTKGIDSHGIHKEMKSPKFLHQKTGGRRGHHEEERHLGKRETDGGNTT
jgi:hypothetical protein